jgi:hypothetical protein
VLPASTHSVTHLSLTTPPSRSAELARQRSSLEERLAVAEARHAALEQAFAAYREQVGRDVREPPLGELRVLLPADESLHVGGPAVHLDHSHSLGKTTDTQQGIAVI